LDYGEKLLYRRSRADHSGGRGGGMGQAGLWPLGGSQAGWASRAHGPSCQGAGRSGRLFSCRARLALWAQIEAQPSPTSCSCQPRPEKIMLGPCLCRAKKSCFGPAHGPRAKWPSISPSRSTSVVLTVTSGLNFDPSSDDWTRK
jgi:hypothetical protein